MQQEGLYLLPPSVQSEPLPAAAEAHAATSPSGRPPVSCILHSSSSLTKSASVQLKPLSMHVVAEPDLRHDALNAHLYVHGPRPHDRRCHGANTLGGTTVLQLEEDVAAPRELPPPVLAPPSWSMSPSLRARHSMVPVGLPPSLSS